MAMYVQLQREEPEAWEGKNLPTALGAPSVLGGTHWLLQNGSYSKNDLENEAHAPVRA